jgi:hypothetical protein
MSDILGSRLNSAFNFPDSRLHSPFRILRSALRVSRFASSVLFYTSFKCIKKKSFLPKKRRAPFKRGPAFTAFRIPRHREASENQTAENSRTSVKRCAFSVQRSFKLHLLVLLRHLNVPNLFQGERASEPVVNGKRKVGNVAVPILKVHCDIRFFEIRLYFIHFF